MIKDEDVEEEDPVPLGTPRRLTMKVVIHQVAYSPSGTRSVLQSASYNFKNAIAGETTIAKYNREEVKRKSMVRAVAKFDPAKREAANAKRRKLAQPEAAPAPALLAAAPAALVHVPAALPKAPRMVPAEGPDRETKRDLALLRAWMDHRGDAEAALAELRERGLDVLGGADEPWTVRRAQERHEFLCRCVRTFARLLPEGADMRRVCGLMRQCS